ncbi:glycoside hydrolase family 3 C-terminal domain-containing protein [Nocardia sp. NPDC051981]|uniref:glycoside hydrolase family 3 C-terminal domain-containing protein n=1 Tax=Nocardia sp. NPDC051981 TaxID=3155417 RepID=UPI00342BB682
MRSQDGSRQARQEVPPPGVSRAERNDHLTESHGAQRPRRTHERQHRRVLAHAQSTSGGGQRRCAAGDSESAVAGLRRRTREAGRPVQLTLEFRPELPGGFPVARLMLETEEVFGTPAEELARAEELAAAADVAIVVVGTTETIESEGIDRPTLALPDGQEELVRRVLAADPRTVVIVNSGGPVVLPWPSEAPATLLTWFPQQFGAVLADVLSGATEPGGRMPTTWAAAEADVPVWQVEPVDGRLDYAEGIHVGYREWLRRAAAGGPAPAVPFGHGLGYSGWEIADPALAAGSDEQAVVAVEVTNVGQRGGKHVVQAYVSRTAASAFDRPVCWLMGHAVVRAQPGETVTARLESAHPPR